MDKVRAMIHRHIEKYMNGANRKLNDQKKASLYGKRFENLKKPKK